MEFDAVRVQILGKGGPPSLNETIAIVLAKEERKRVMIECPGEVVGQLELSKKVK